MSTSHVQLAVQPQSTLPTLLGESIVNTRSKNPYEDFGAVKEDSQLSSLHGIHDDRTRLATNASAIDAQENPFENRTWKLNQVEGEEIEHIVTQEHELVEATKGNLEQLTGHGHRLDSNYSDASTRYTEPEIVTREPAYISTTGERSSAFPFEHQEITNQMQGKFENMAQSVSGNISVDPRRNASELTVRTTNVIMLIYIHRSLRYMYVYLFKSFMGAFN